VSPHDNPWAAPTASSNAGFGNSAFFGHGADVEMGATGGRDALNDFETSLPLRLDYEACLAYVLLPPAGGVVLLLLEWKSDYVR
jgi:hypothetical protein